MSGLVHYAALYRSLLKRPSISEHETTVPPTADYVRFR